MTRVLQASGQEPLLVLDSQGRLVRQLPAGISVLDVHTLPAGLYLVRSGQQVERLMVE